MLTQTSRARSEAGAGGGRFAAHAHMDSRLVPRRSKRGQSSAGSPAGNCPADPSAAGRRVRRPSCAARGRWRPRDAKTRTGSRRMASDGGKAVAASSGPISRLRLGSGLGAIDMAWTGPAPGRRRQTQASGAAHQGGDDGGPSAAPRMRRNTIAGQHVIFLKKTRGTDDADHRSPSSASCEQRSRSRKTSSFHLVRSPGLPAARRTVEA